MNHASEQTRTFIGEQGLSIFYRYHQAESERARVVIAHGLGEHSGRYLQVIKRLINNGISVWAMDHRGHGRSQGSRGHILSFNDYILDLKQMLAIARKEMPVTMKLFLLGHSMGGCMALFLSQSYPEAINGVIASSPGLRPAMKVPVIKGAVGKMMSSIWPTLTLDNELNSSHISHDSSVVAAYDNDPLVHRRVSARWFTEFMAAMERTLQRASEVTIPILMQVAGDDRIVDPEASRQFFKNVRSSDKTLYLYDGLYHEIYNETEDHRKKVLSDLDNWLNEHI